MKRLSNDQLAFLLARVTIGLNFLMHGLVRFPKLRSFAEGLAEGFESTPLPYVLVYPFAIALPFIEGIIGLLLLVGLRTKLAAVTGFFLMTVLIFGAALKEDWQLVGAQMIYVLFFFLFIKNLRHNTIALDRLKKENTHGFTIER